MIKTITKDLPRELKQLIIYPLADLHIADRLCKEKLIKERINQIKDTPNMFTVLNGDLCNMALPNSKSDSFSAKYGTDKQLEVVVDLLMPIKDKVLFITPGNHEARMYNTTGFDATKHIADKLGLSDIYASPDVLLFVRFGRVSDGKKDKIGEVRKIVYSIYAKHGFGGGKKEGGKINNLVSLAEVVDADVYMMSHTHTPMTTKNKYNRINYQNNSVQEVTKLFVMTAACLEYGDYGSAGGFKPASTDNPYIILESGNKFAHADL